jgi:hypothetical protein
MTWPDLPPEADPDYHELRKTLFAGQTDAAKAALRNPVDEAVRVEARAWTVDDRDETEAAALRSMAYAAEYDRAKTIHDQRVAVVMAGFQRAQSAAEFVRNAAAGILAVYQAVLGLAFVAKDRPLPVSGVMGTVFLALAAVAATAYVAWLSAGKSVAPPAPSASLKVYQDRRLNSFSAWVSSAVLERVYFMHVAVVSLFIGAIMLPLPFIVVRGIDFSDPLTATVVLVVGLLAVVLLPRMFAAIRFGTTTP